MNDDLPKILIVDDQPANLFALRQLLRKVNVEVIEAGNGNDALACTLDHHLALILLDVQMPEMDGYEVASLLRSNDDTRYIPIIFVTAAYKDDSHRMLGYGAGAVDYVEKPIEDAILLSKVRVFIELYERKRELKRMLSLMEETNRHLMSEIAERKAAEEALKQAKEAAEAANRAKSAFIANMSHELRTPLNAILGFARILGHATDLSEEHRHTITIIADSGEILRHLIDDILDLTRIEAGRFDIVTTPCDLTCLFDNLSPAFALNAGQRSISLNFHALTPLPMVMADEHRLRQIGMNLLSNALKFTVQGEVTMTAAYRDGWLMLEVSDTGIGITSERLDTLFYPFIQAQQDPYTQQEDGLGLGLAITKALVEQMGGTIEVESRPGEGSRFTLRVPLPLTADIQMHHSPPVHGRIDGPADVQTVDELPPSIERVPDALLESLRQAVVVGSSPAIDAALAVIEPHDPALTATLRGWIAEYHYDRVAALLHTPDTEVVP